MSGKDTVQVIVYPARTSNHAPVANAGKDTTIDLPDNTITLDGSKSTDTDNNIASYLWKQISGPSSNNIANANGVQTQATNLLEGIYQFELTVTDAGGLFSKDTISVTVSFTNNCDSGLLRIVSGSATLDFVGSLSQKKDVHPVAVADKIIFAGGILSEDPVSGIAHYTNGIDIYNLSTNTWSTATLSSVDDFSSVVAGNKILYLHSSSADVYDAVADRWSVIPVNPDI